MPLPTSTEVANYMNTAQRVVLQFQFVEEALKAYISVVRDILQASIPAEIDFRQSHEEIDSMPLGRLIQTFGRYTRNQELLRQLTQLTPLRNHVAHKALAYGFYSSFTEDIEFEQESKALEDARQASGSAFLALNTEIDLVNRLLSSKKSPSEA